jgi:hypothetical protein
MPACRPYDPAHVIIPASTYLPGDRAQPLVEHAAAARSEVATASLSVVMYPGHDQSSGGSMPLARRSRPLARLLELIRLGVEPREAGSPGGYLWHGVDVGAHDLGEARRPGPGSAGGRWAGR